MVPEQLGKPVAWLFVPFLLLLLIACGGAAPAAPAPAAEAPPPPVAETAPVAGAEPGAAPTVFTSSVDRLRLALLPPPP